MNTFQTVDKAPEPRQNYINTHYVGGAGLRWRPLHFNAEAPTEPAGETGLPIPEYY